MCDSGSRNTFSLSSPSTWQSTKMILLTGTTGPSFYFKQLGRCSSFHIHVSIPSSVCPLSVHLSLFYLYIISPSLIHLFSGHHVFSCLSTVTHGYPSSIYPSASPLTNYLSMDSPTVQPSTCLSAHILSIYLIYCPLSCSSVHPSFYLSIPLSTNPSIY